MADVKWDVEFYERSNGRCPAREFFATLTGQEKEFVRRALTRLSTYGHRLDRPHAAYLRGQIYELRIRTPDGQLRLLYSFVEGPKIVITQGFKKKTGVVPPGEIETAIRHRADYLSCEQKE